MVRKKTHIGKKMKNHKKKYQLAVQKRREEMREIIKKLKEQKTMEKLDSMKKLYEEECKKRKKAEYIANNYYREWKTEREAKDKALENQIYKPSSLPDSFYIKSSLLNFDLGGNGDEIIGAGVFGTVKLCQYKGNIVAAKFLKEARETAAKRSVVKEAKVLLNLKSHNSVPTLLGVCLDEEPYKIILHFYHIDRKSVTLNLLCKKPQNDMFSEDEWHSILNNLAKAIDHVHICGYLHNDIKTDNVLIYKNGDTHIPVLIDFGKSCKREEGVTKCMTASEQEMYKKQYKHIAPEIIDGSYKQSIYSDIYSFGYLVCCIYTIICTNSSRLRKIVKECYKVKTWNCRASLTRISQILE